MLGLPELISTRMTLELANRAICTPARIARDVFVSVGKFTFPADFVIVDYESDPRVPLILGRPFLRTARALIDVHGEEMILRDSDERLTLNMRHDTSSYSNQPQKESINLGGNILLEKLLDLDSIKDLHTPLHVNPLSGSTTSSSSPNKLLEEFADELALITFSTGNDDLPFDNESNLKEIEYMLLHDPIKDINSILKDTIDQNNLVDLNDNLIDSMPEMFTSEHALDYSSPSLYDEYDDDLFEVESDTKTVYDDPFDSKGEKIEESKLLVDELDLPCNFLLPFEYDSFISKYFSEVDALPSTNNEDKAFNPGILIQENLFEIITRVAQDKKLAISHVSLMLEDFDPPLYELPLFKEVPRLSIHESSRRMKTDSVKFKIKDRLKAACDRQKSYADKKRKPLEFSVGDYVLLKVSPWKSVVRFGKKGKLAPRFVGPFEIIKKVGPVAYRLDFLKELNGVHDTFHVSNLKKCLVDQTLQVHLDEIRIDAMLNFVEEPVEILE
nr:reverse transcriptase domain-containing protein [Tanacetum cinerariifolium]